jgi:hypothetical protein
MYTFDLHVTSFCVICMHVVDKERKLICYLGIISETSFRKRGVLATTTNLLCANTRQSGACTAVFWREALARNENWLPKNYPVAQSPPCASWTLCRGLLSALCFFCSVCHGPSFAMCRVDGLSWLGLYRVFSWRGIRQKSLLCFVPAGHTTKILPTAASYFSVVIPPYSYLCFDERIRAATRLVTYLFYSIVLLHQM